jgi:hypothetical protein
LLSFVVHQLCSVMIFLLPVAIFILYFQVPDILVSVHFSDSRYFPVPISPAVSLHVKRNRDWKIVVLQGCLFSLRIIFAHYVYILLSFNCH